MSLRVRVLWIILTVNLAVAGLLGVILLREQESIRDLKQENYYLRSIQVIMDELNAGIGAAELTAPRILGWPEWRKYFREVVIVNQDFTAFGPRGLYLNPLGASERRGDFDREAVERGLRRAVHGRHVVELPEGRCEVLRAPADGQVIGAIYYELRLPPIGRRDISAPLLILALSTAVLIVALYLAISRSVAVPLERLTAAVGRLAGGERTPVQVRSGSSEVQALARGFNAAMAEVHSFRDRLEREVARVTEEVRRQERQLLLSARLAAMGTLAAGIAHEINNPLGGIVNAFRRVKSRTGGDPALAAYLALAEEGLDRIAATVRRVLEFVPREAPPTVFPLVAAVRRAEAFVAHRAGRLGLAVAIAGDETVLVRGDPQELQQVFLNLLLNAMDALEERAAAEPGFAPRLEVAVAAGVREEVAVAAARVRDNGPGLDPAVAERVFDLFFTTKEAGKGTGLGLAISYAIIRNHGGSIEVATRPGQGFEAVVVLPAAGGEGS